MWIPFPEVDNFCEMDVLNFAIDCIGVQSRDNFKEHIKHMDERKVIIKSGIAVHNYIIKLFV